MEIRDLPEYVLDASEQTRAGVTARKAGREIVASPSVEDICEIRRHVRLAGELSDPVLVQPLAYADVVAADPSRHDLRGLDRPCHRTGPDHRDPATSDPVGELGGLPPTDRGQGSAVVGFLVGLVGGLAVSSNEHRCGALQIAHRTIIADAGWQR
jgi:hypothetical protein